MQAWYAMYKMSEKISSLHPENPLPSEDLLRLELKVTETHEAVFKTIRVLEGQQQDINIINSSLVVIMVALQSGDMTTPELKNAQHDLKTHLEGRILYDK